MAVVVAKTNTIATVIVTESVLRDKELAGLYWTDPHLPDHVVSALLRRSQPTEDMADMSEWPSELDVESRAIHSDLAKASFRTLSED